jgi:hypothetical protein
MTILTAAFARYKKILCSGMDEPSDAAASTTPKLEKESNAVALKTRLGTTTIVESSVPEEFPAPVTTKAKGNDAGAGPVKGDKPKIDEPAPEILSGELIVPPPPASINPPEARLITAGEVASTPQKQPNAEEEYAMGTSSGTIRVATHCSNGTH